MENLNRARTLAGKNFKDMSDADVSEWLEVCETQMKRPFKSNEGSYFQAALDARRSFLQKQAGIAQPKFTAEMYGSSRMTNSADRAEGYQGE